MINTAQKSRAYSEVYSFLNALGNYYISKIPDALYDSIKDNRDKNYNPTYNINDDITKKNISHEGLALISAINLKYWCHDLNEKERLKKIYVNNEKLEIEKYSYNNLMNNRKDEEPETIHVEILECKESLIQKIMKKIKKFFRFKN